MRIGFCNGCWDTFHEGHANFLTACMAQCDYLVVAVNSDASVKRLKGNGRPSDNWRTRAWNVNMHLPRAYSAIIPFEGDEGPLLMAIRPHIRFVGHDHSPDPVFYRTIGWKHSREGEIMEGPEIIQIPKTVDISTTQILEG